VYHSLKPSSWSLGALSSIFGSSSALAASAQTTMRDTQFGVLSSPSSTIDEALNVASCRYETNTAWGKEVGLLPCLI